MPEEKNLAARLLEAEPPPSRGDALLQSLLESERVFEERVRRAALVSGSAAWVCLVMGAAAAFAARNLGGGAQEAARFALVVIAATGFAALSVAALTSLVWLFRRRTPTLRAIERRLAAMEELLRGRG